METHTEPPHEIEKLPVDPNRFRLSTPSPEPKKQDAKAAAILEACEWKDVDTLRLLTASEGGLVSDDVRRQACSCNLRKAHGLTLTLNTRASATWLRPDQQRHRFSARWYFKLENFA